MENHEDIRHRIMEIVIRSPGCDMEEMLRECPDLTWNQVFFELDHLSRSGQVGLRQSSLGRYSVVPGREVEVAATIH
jgi:hypothetical protein